MKHKYNVKVVNDITTVKEVLKQCIQLKAQKNRKYEKRSRSYKQNTFKTNRNYFYREMKKSTRPTEKKNSIQQ